MSDGARRFLPHALLLAMIALWGGSFVATKALLAEVGPFTLLAARFWFAAFCLLPFLLRRPGVRRELASCARVGLLAGVALALGYVLQTIGMRETRASTGGLIAGLIPLLVAFGGWLFLRARPGPHGLIGFALGVFGMALLLWPSAVVEGTAPDTLRGVLLQIGSVTSYAAHVLLLSRFAAAVPVLAFSFWQIVFVALVATVVVPIAEPEPAFAALAHGAQFLQLSYLAVLATSVAIGVQAVVQPRIAPTHVALLFATQPLFASLAGWLILDERLGLMQVGGGVAIVGGIVIAAFDRASSALRD